MNGDSRRTGQHRNAPYLRQTCAGAAGLISKHKHKRLGSWLRDSYAKRIDSQLTVNECSGKVRNEPSSSDVNRTFVQSYLDFNSVVKTLAQNIIYT